MACRRDVFAKRNLSVPVTWDEFLDVALALNGSDFNGDGKPDYALCLTSNGDYAYFTLTVLASYHQYRGSTQGVLFDPETLEPLVRILAG